MRGDRIGKEVKKTEAKRAGSIYVVLKYPKWVPINLQTTILVIIGSKLMHSCDINNRAVVAELVRVLSLNLVL